VFFYNIFSEYDLALWTACENSQKREIMLDRVLPYSSPFNLKSYAEFNEMKQAGKINSGALNEGS